MTRAILLPTPCDPFLLNYWFYFFDKWSSSIDKLYICLNSTIEAEVIDYIKGICAKRFNVVVLYVENQIEHGDALSRLLDMCTEDLIGIIEDDCYINVASLDVFFNPIESGLCDIVGSKRGSCGEDIIDGAFVKWGITMQGDGDVGPNFWPNLFFCRRSLLLSIPRNFGAKAWFRGETIAPLNRVVEAEVCCGDTFVEASLELRAVVPENRIMYVPQNHASPSDLEHYRDGRYIFNGSCYWVHIGSLSSGVGGVLTDSRGVCLARRTLNDEPRVEASDDSLTMQEKQEWERRVQMWQTFYNHRERGKLEEFSKLYIEAIEKLITRFGLSRKRVNSRIEAYRTIGYG